jgi:hypothetical protein
MRAFARAFGLACGSIVIAIAARYGFKTSDNDFDGYIWAFTYGSVTLGGLFGHSLGVQAWRHSKLVGVLVFAGGAFALLISLSNSIGAMAGRGKTPAPAGASPKMAARKAELEASEAPQILEAVAIESAPVAFVAPPKPRLISSRPYPAGSVATIMAEIMEPGRGKVEIADVFEAYADACEASGKRPISANEFPAAMAALCKKLGIKLKDSGDGVFLLRVKVKNAKMKAAMQ